jgi:hypothetical protein
MLQRRRGYGHRIEELMLSKCLNPHCSAKFRYLGQGRLFRVDFTEAGRKTASNGQSTGGKAPPIEHFWLCESCAATMTLELGGDGAVRAVPFELSAKMPPAAARPARRLVANAS